MTGASNLPNVAAEVQNLQGQLANFQANFSGNWMRLEAGVGVKPRSPKGRAAARGLDARPCLQHPPGQRETSR
jgi:hypothetical protein